eukprot:scaffold1811_cov411-Prasinococcus_capsulatus_cf.AAC.15
MKSCILTRSRWPNRTSLGGGLRGSGFLSKPPGPNIECLPRYFSLAFGSPRLARAPSNGFGEETSFKPASAAGEGSGVSLGCSVAEGVSAIAGAGSSYRKARLLIDSFSTSASFRISTSLLIYALLSFWYFESL